MNKYPDKRIYFVYKNSFNVLKDYLNSLNIFYEYIELSDINKYYNKDDIFIFSQMWLQEQNDDFYKCKNVMFLNVEQLSESKRLDHILVHLKHNIPIIDYSLANIMILKEYIEKLNINYTSRLMLLPYQFNSMENFNIKNTEEKYEYDVGIINGFVKKDESVSDEIIYKRNIIWEKIQKENWKYINIMGWGEERDSLIKKCKIIINVHLFDVFNIFEHIRCDRLTFANKIIISEKSIVSSLLDIKDYVIWEDFDKIIDTTHYVLNNFDKFNKQNNFTKLINSRKNTLDETMNTIIGYSEIKNWYREYSNSYKDIKDRLGEYHKRVCFSFGSLEDEYVEQYLAMKYISSNDIILEIGGNIGRVSCLLATILEDDNNLLVLESDNSSYKNLLQNKNQNNLQFNIENKALSDTDLFQAGWKTYNKDEITKLDKEIYSQLKKVECIELDEIYKKYNLKFNTLVIDCEGAFYYIIKSFPGILDNINKIIIENDYPTWEMKEYVENIFLKNNFKTVETISLDDKFCSFHPNKLIRENFYQVKMKTKN